MQKILVFIRIGLPIVLGVAGFTLLTSTSAKPVAGNKSSAEAPLNTQASAAPEPWQRFPDWPESRWDQFSTLSEVKTPAAATTPASASAGDAEKGKELAFDRTRGGSCVACHIMGPETPEMPGNVGPDLSDIGAQRNDEMLLRYTFDARQFNPGTVMPPWGAHGLFNEEEIGHIIAFLKTLKAPAAFQDPLDDPAKRPQPKERRNNLDEFENPGMQAVDTAIEIFARKGPAGKACADCHAKPEQRFKTWAAGMPKYEPRMNKVLGVEEFVARHAAATTGEALLMSTPENMAMAVYLRHLANGAAIKVDIQSDGAQQAAGRGKALMERKIGQLNFACIDCHQQAANRWIRGQWLTAAKGQTPHFPTWRTSRQEMWDLRKRFQWCNVAVRANELPPDAPEYGDLELYLTSLNNGLRLNVPGIRH